MSTPFLWHIADCLVDEILAASNPVQKKSLEWLLDRVIDLLNYPVKREVWGE